MAKICKGKTIVQEDAPVGDARRVCEEDAPDDDVKTPIGDEADREQDADEDVGSMPK